MDEATRAMFVKAIAPEVIEMIAGFGDDPLAAGGAGEDYGMGAGPAGPGPVAPPPPGEGEAVTDDLDEDEDTEDESVAEQPEEKTKPEAYSSDANRETYSASLAAEIKRVRDDNDAKIARYSAQVEYQQKTINALLAERENTYRQGVLSKCVLEGIDLDVEKELTRLSRYAARDDFDAEVENIRVSYKRSDGLAEDFLPVNGVHPYAKQEDQPKRQSREEMLAEVDAMTRYGYSGDPSVADAFVEKYNASRKATV
jgi:hypothetical protein